MDCTYFSPDSRIHVFFKGIYGDLWFSVLFLDCKSELIHNRINPNSQSFGRQCCCCLLYRLGRCCCCHHQWSVIRRKSVSQLDVKISTNQKSSSFFQSVCLLGYCIFPLVLAALAIWLVHYSWNNVWFRCGVSLGAFVWSTWGEFSFTNYEI